MGSGGNQSQTTTSSLPPELSSWANKYLNALGNLVLPNGQLGQSPLPYQEVAPLTPQQIQGMQLTSNETYGPSGQAAGVSQASGTPINPNQLMSAIAASPYWQALMKSQPSTASAFSPAALNQLPGVY